MTGWQDDDEDLLALLRDALAEQRDVPTRFVEAGKATFAWRSIDAELAALAYDSVADPSALAGATRADRAAIRELTFAFRDATVHVQIARAGLHGQVVPARAGEVERAFGWLTRAVDSGWSDLNQLSTDHDLAALWNDARFHQLRARLGG